MANKRAASGNEVGIDPEIGGPTGKLSRLGRIGKVGQIVDIGKIGDIDIGIDPETGGGTLNFIFDFSNITILFFLFIFA